MSKGRDWLFNEDYIDKRLVGCEVGVHFGNFSKRILKLAKPSLLYLVDPWKISAGHDSPLFGDRGEQEELDRLYSNVYNRYKQNENVMVIRDSSTKKILDEHLDWIYLDGDHSYDGTYNALVDGYRCIKYGGVIAGDDYHINGWWKRQVISAVNDFIKNYEDIEVVTVQRNQFVLRKTP